MKKFIILILCIICDVSHLFAQQYDHSYDVIGFADGDEIVQSIIIGLGLLFLAFLIFKLNKTNNNGK